MDTERTVESLSYDRFCHPCFPQAGGKPRHYAFHALCRVLPDPDESEDRVFFSCRSQG